MSKSCAEDLVESKNDVECGLIDLYQSGNPTMQRAYLLMNTRGLCFIEMIQQSVRPPLLVRAHNCMVVAEGKKCCRSILQQSVSRPKVVYVSALHICMRVVVKSLAMMREPYPVWFGSEPCIVWGEEFGYTKHMSTNDGYRGSTIRKVPWTRM